MKKKRTRREMFLADMERIVPWARLEAAIAPSYPRSGRVGRPPIGVPRMLRMYCLQQWYGLADEAVVDAPSDQWLQTHPLWHFDAVLGWGRPSHCLLQRNVPEAVDCLIRGSSTTDI